MAKQGSHQKAKENRNMLLASKKPRCHQDHGYFPLLFRPQTNTFLNIRLDFSGWRTHSFSCNALQFTKYSNTQYECYQHCSARKPDNTLISSFNVNVPFYRLHDFYYQSKYISIINVRTGKICAGHT